MRLPSSIALVTMAVVLAACGSESRQAAAPGSPENPLVAKPTEQTGGTGRTNEGTGQASSAPGYQKLLERQSSAPQRRFTPCNLVSRAQAKAILGTPIMAPVEAPQGPTCIYRSQNGKSFVTLAVQGVELQQAKRQLHTPKAVGVAHRPGYCGTYGQPMLYVGLSDNRVLSVAAPCAVAQRFAAHAVARLTR